MLGSFQRARDVLRNEVTRLNDAQAALESLVEEERKSDVQAEIKALRRKREGVREERDGLRAQLTKVFGTKSRDNADIECLRTCLAELTDDLKRARADTLKEATSSFEAQRQADLSEQELAQRKRTEAALEDILLVQWEMLQDLATQIDLVPPWRCGLCSCRNPYREATCTVCESPKDGKTDLGNKSVEAYFEFRLHQEFLGRDPAPEPERRLAAIQIALAHRSEKWIEAEELEELHQQLKAVANDQGTDPVLRAEAAFMLFKQGDDDEGRRLGRLMLRSMGENSDAVRRMCRKQRQQRVAVLYQRVMQMKKEDADRFAEWHAKLEQAQAHFCRSSTTTLQSSKLSMAAAEPKPGPMSQAAASSENSARSSAKSSLDLGKLSRLVDATPLAKATCEHDEGDSDDGPMSDLDDWDV